MNLRKYPDLVRYQLPVLFWMLFIFALSSIPGASLAPIEFPYAHLIAHSVLFGMLYYLAYRALKYQHFSRFLSEFSLLVTMFFVMLYGASDEYHQSFVPGRTEEFKDFMIDLTAALIVLIVIVVADKLRLGRNKVSAS